jgi:hypothetical protein
MTNNDMPTPKSSNEGNTTKKIITEEMERTLPMAEVLKLGRKGGSMPLQPNHGPCPRMIAQTPKPITLPFIRLRRVRSDHPLIRN